MSKRLKGIFLIITVVTLFLGGIYPVSAAGEVYISAFTANDDKGIDPNDEFALELEITNESGSGDGITDVGITFGADASFQPVAGRDVSFSSEIPDGESRDKTFDMIYTGGTDKNLPITITYTDSNGDPQSVSTSIYIKNADPEDSSDDGGSSSSGSVDKSKYKPSLQIDSEAIPEGKAGGVIEIPLQISNIANYEARDVIITPELGEIPFVIDQMIVYEKIEKIKADKSADISFQFQVDKYAKEGTYTIPLKMTYENAYGYVFPEETKEIYVKITNTNLPPQLVVREASSDPAEVEPDQEFIVTFDLWNMGTITAENVTIDMEANEHFHILDNVTKQYLFELKGLNNRQITYALKAKEDLETGTYGVTVSLNHKDAEDPEAYTMYVFVKGDEEEEEEDVNIITENIVTPQGSVLAGHPFTISMDIKNAGTTPAEDVKVTVDAGELILPQSLNVIQIPEIEAGASIPVAFSFIADEECESRSYSIKATIDYKNGEEDVKKEQYMGVLIENEKQETMLNTIPKIIISEYATEPGMVNAGENFTLNMKFLNTSKLKSVQNMKITLVVDESSEETGSVFTPVQSSNTFYIDNLRPGETSEKHMVMYTIPDAKAKTYVVKALFEYEYEEQDQIKQNNMEDVFGIPVVQPAKLEATDVIVSEPAFVGEPVYLTAEFYNMGKVALSNLMIKAEGDFDAKESNYFVGNFEMGSGDYYEAPVTPLAPGELKGVLVFTFEDAAGKSHQIEREFTINAMEAEPVMNPNFPGGEMGMDGMMPGMEEPQKSGFPVLPVAIGGGVVIAVVVLIIVLKKRKKKKELMFDEDI